MVHRRNRLRTIGAQRRKASLWQHPPKEQGKRYVELGGRADAAVATARESDDQGDFRWAAEIAAAVPGCLHRRLLAMRP
ncbi:alkyl sulfatase dimerization domain-containing protein [Nocardia cyriacigeorgica]|uniref:alkyl sulfatase dimerization domain-containing protein n=1 Tax=Nocardia cyriacigeorgica TaxID=135487 RepID=UPI001894CB73|nr:alkyl sulfatase dimerization domain-containing protein [Nocardia cyriacigeorgica]MBF6414893.1 hypothetical protein [Nocardia cyriacigeorgica]